LITCERRGVIHGNGENWEFKGKEWEVEVSGEGLLLEQVDS
jgi:hypothetical protein